MSRIVRSNIGAIKITIKARLRTVLDLPFLVGLFYFDIMSNAGKSWYQAMLQKPLWQKKRLEIMNRDNWTCQRCSDKDSELQIHHISYYKNPWEADNKDLITLCNCCHGIVENQKNSEIKALKKSDSVAAIVGKKSGMRRLDSLLIEVVNSII